MNGEYDLWLEQKQFLKGNTGFIDAIPNTTLMTPSTATNIVVCSTYNQVEGKLYIDSGKGFTRDGRIVPTIAIPGQNIRTIAANNKSVIMSGPAVSGAVLAGIVTLMYQWGLVLGNDINIYYSKIKSYFISSTTKEKNQEYPNIETGFGVLNIKKLFQTLNEASKLQDGAERHETIELDCKEKGGLFICIPRDIYKRIKAIL